MDLKDKEETQYTNNNNQDKVGRPEVLVVLAYSCGWIMNRGIVKQVSPVLLVKIYVCNGYSWPFALLRTTHFYLTMSIEYERVSIKIRIVRLHGN